MMIMIRFVMLSSGECSIASLALETKLREEMAMLEETLSVLDSPIVFCHNDLLLNNVLFDDEKSTLIHFLVVEMQLAVNTRQYLQTLFILSTTNTQTSIIKLSI